MSDANSKRTERLQIMLSDQELTAIDDWRFKYRLPSRAAAIRDLIRRGMLNEGMPAPDTDKTSTQFSSLIDPADDED
jgi:hypothetical protein